MNDKRTVVDNGVEVVFQFPETQIKIGNSNLDAMIGNKAERKLLDSKGQIWLTTQSNIQPTSKVDIGGLGSHNLWELVGEIPVGKKRLYVWECTFSSTAT